MLLGRDKYVHPYYNVYVTCTDLIIRDWHRGGGGVGGGGVRSSLFLLGDPQTSIKGERTKVFFFFFGGGGTTSLRVISTQQLEVLVIIKVGGAKSFHSLKGGA